MSDLNDDNPFEEYNPEEEPLPEEEMDSEAAPGSGGNRNFMMALVAIVALIVVGFGIILFLVLRKPSASTVMAEQEQVLATNTAIAQLGTQQALAAIAMKAATTTPLPTAVPPTHTPVIAVPTATQQPVASANQAETPDPTVLATLATGQADPNVGGGAPTATLSPGAMRTATLGALLTQVAANQQGTGQVGGSIAATSTALPATGFADEVGLPGLLGLALGLVVLIFLTRTLRLTTK
jgi:multisubunit Na+/H+ antiporter MnhB subunit